MFTVTKRMEISGAHTLILPYASKCNTEHGHNWIIEVEVGTQRLDKFGMVIDFVHIKEALDKLDHRNINEVLGELNPTAENIAVWIAKEITKIIDVDTWHLRGPNDPLPYIAKITVQESEGNIICYIP